MTRVEAIRELNFLFVPAPIEPNKRWGCKRNEALSMAIDALSAETINTEKLKLMKFVAIKGDKTEEAYRTGWNSAIECIIENVLSSAELPNLKQEFESAEAVQVVRCKDCRWRKACKVFSHQQITDDSFCSWGERREP